MVQANRILIVISSLGGGGAERVSVDLSRHLSDSGREVVLLTLSGDEPDAYVAPEKVRRERIELRQSGAPWFTKVLTFAARLRAMRRKILGIRPDVVISFVDHTNVRVILSLLGSGVPVVVSERVYPGRIPLGWLWRMGRQVSYPLAAAVTVQTETGAQWFRSNTRVTNAVVIPNAARFAEDVAIGPEITSRSVTRPLVLAMGRLDAQKGFDLLLQAFRQSGLAGQGWRLAILGEGPERANLEREAIELGIAEAVAMPGYVRNIADWLRQADLFVLSSRFEGFPNALLEAMQCGVACISFDCPSGPRELIEDNVSGCLAAPEDVVSLAGKMRRLGNDADLRAQLATAAIEVAQRFSPKQVYDRWLQLVDDVAAGRSGPKRSEPVPVDPALKGIDQLRRRPGGQP